MREERPLHERIIMVLSFVMGIFYVVAGVGIMVFPVEEAFGLPLLAKYAFGALLVVYGIFRTARAYKKSAL